MKDLMLSEWRRFSRLALIGASLHLLALLFLNRTTNLLALSYFEAQPIWALYCLLGLILGVLQVGSYRKPSQWLWLLHRPLPPRQIFLALAGSAGLLLATLIALPQLLFLLALDLLSTQLVESRHYLGSMHLLAYSAMAWLGGAYACCSRRRLALLAAVAPMAMSLHLISAWWLLLPVGVALAWLLWIASSGFRANREAPIERWWDLLLTALPLQLGAFMVTFAIGQMLWLIVTIVAGTDPLNTDFPPEGGVIEVMRAEPAEELVMGLTASADPRASGWASEVPLLEPVRIGPNLSRFPLRHQVAELNMPTSWWDEERQTVWRFSHDHMLFHGRDPQSGRERGWWGVGGAGDRTPFAEVPFASHQGYLLTPSVLYRIDPIEQRQYEWIRLGLGERFVDAPDQQLDRWLVLTNQRLLVFHQRREAAQRFEPPELDWAMPLADEVRLLEGVVVARLMEGWLVSQLYGEGTRQVGFTRYSRIAQPWQQISLIDAQDQISVIAERPLQADFSAYSRVSWWYSPLLHAFSEWPDQAMEKGLSYPLNREVWPELKGFHLLALSLMLLSTLLAWGYLRGSTASRGRRGFWLLNCGLFGLPALISLICLEPGRPAGPSAS
ncbi:hypothetical protein [Pseudomarimonas arenosa]|uniref:ABC transporter permease n=1 Tax=Pseudomarimonas arenosa TaxID=2774145 RepID=A0AAW3ZIH7_9GAMM|nr:hypothetical protein [Pseudomarimonas arenosa]MBD8525230.1 hypothetical protein [Pseudomarimonas arenosa]